MRLRDWRIKALVQSVLSVAPGGVWLNERLQMRVGGLHNFSANISSKVDDWCQIVGYLKTAGCASVIDQTILEVGSGWYPTLPICFALAGAGHIYTVDLNRHMNEDTSLRMVCAIEPHLDRIASAFGSPTSAVQQRWAVLRKANSLAQLMDAAKITYRAPTDARRVEWLKDDGIDLAYSNSVLEHVFPAVLPGIMGELRRVLRPGGVMLHAVACNDHYAHFDKTISPLNYLQFPERQWRWLNNELNYQNRLRASSFLRMARACGFEVVHEARAVRPNTRETLRTMKLAPEFEQFDREDLVVTSTDFVAVKPLG
jgi:SAM-dependent methyltransferase